MSFDDFGIARHDFTTLSKASVYELTRSSGVAFGTSGARGLVTAMTDRVCYGYTAGFLQFLAEEGFWKSGMRVALAGDLRQSTIRIIVACAQAVRDLGGEPVFCGYVPTPALAYWAFGARIPSIMVTGSHIPDDRNGIKFYRPDGEILKADEPSIMRQVVDLGPNRWTNDEALIDAPSLPLPVNVGSAYCARYVDFFGQDALSGLKVGVYQHSAVGRDILAQILTSLGADVLTLGRSDSFIPVDTEAVRAEDIDLARLWARQYGLDAIASTDGDSDRPLLADHTGEWLRGDILGVLCARALNMSSVVTPVSSNTLVEKCGFFGQVHRTRIGSPYVIAAMDAAIARGERSVCGYEANGGFLLASQAELSGRRLSSLPTRDAVLPIVASLVASRPGRLRDMLATLPRRATFSDRLQNFKPAARDSLMAWLLPGNEELRHAHLTKYFGAIAGAALKSLNLVDGVRMEFSNAKVIHLRGSGNAPELRCYSEAEDSCNAQRINRGALELVRAKFAT